MITRRQALAATAAFAGLAGAAAPTFAQTRSVDGWPARPVRVIIPSGPGGPAETFRTYAERLREAFGQTFVHENQPGASGAIGSSAVARAQPDGYMLLYPANSHVILAPLVTAKKAFDVRKDFEPIALTVTYPFCLLVNAEFPAKSLPELVAQAKANPGKLNFGSIGIGTGGHIVTELLLKRAGIQAVHIPYNGAPAQVQALAANTVQFTVDSIGNSRGAVEAGKVRRIAVTGASRSAAAPDVPTFRELGYDGFELLLWLGLMAPTGTPKGIIQAVNEEVVRINQRPEMRERLAGLAMTPSAGSPADFAALIDADLRLWSKVVEETGVRIAG
jgi:tripartite-type tricarboxylate transporter receptor subunit TctC